jgi:glycosyltransferase involved in cell wall biosynthesis
MKIAVLFNGWINVPHSYAIVNCMQLIHMHKNFSDKIDIYTQELGYFRDEWNAHKQLVYGDEYNGILRSLKKWNGEHIDLIYSITFPYDVSPSVTIPKCVFYTSEMLILDTLYFTPSFNNIEDINTHLLQNKNVYFTTPSLWSSRGMTLNYDIGEKRNRIIPHGSDSTIFKQLPKETRDNLRASIGLTADNIVLGLFGAMTQNKGIHTLLIAFSNIILVHKKTSYRLILKGNDNLYDSKKKVESVLNELKLSEEITKYIIFTGETIDFNVMNEMYNIVDLYVSPYMAEGFNLSPLEALTTGARVLVPRTGSTVEYISDIQNNGGADFITYVDSIIHENNIGQSFNIINDTDLMTAILNVDFSRDLDPSNMIRFINKEYSWLKASELLYEYFLYIIANQNKTDFFTPLKI